MAPENFCNMPDESASMGACAFRSKNISEDMALAVPNFSRAVFSTEDAVEEEDCWNDD